jgi:hypothetical protein
MVSITLGRSDLVLGLNHLHLREEASVAADPAAENSELAR